MFIRWIAFTLVFIGGTGFLAPVWIGALPTDLDRIEFPVSEVSDAAISDDGKLFFALTFWGRVQVYSQSGEFIQSFDIDTLGGTFCLSISGDELTVYIARRDAANKFDLDGFLLDDRIPYDEEAFRDKCGIDKRIDSIEHEIDRVVVSFEDTHRQVTIDRKFWHYLALHPFVSWLMFAIGLFLIPEWRRGVFSSIEQMKKPSTGAKPEGVVLKTIDFILNVFLSLYVLTFLAAFLGIAFLADRYDESSDVGIFSIVLSVFAILLTGYFLYKQWTLYSSEIQFAPGVTLKIGPGGAVA